MKFYGPRQQEVLSPTESDQKEPDQQVELVQTKKYLQERLFKSQTARSNVRCKLKPSKIKIKC